MEDNHRPWGFYDVLSDERDHKVKRITVYPDKRLSLQRHARRAEHWYIVTGEALMTLGEREFTLCAGESVDIPCRAVHRIKNTGVANLVFIETQVGDYFGEDDIERLEDDYSRAAPGGSSQQ
ncbi:MAG TPA: phosphomannose isomerase type II C-terminal cupin domain [Spirochaetota bacterium]|nr:phosphomannose isomerase type II C-terminal cupin domain [Spirochaetota bacterium]HNT11995.1 phosphomannose isomerase type II C-terminal cupin domain [Spirochaetota bacterium]HNV46434.1 phosphomannose isomerase type II C-terminal cupin domain [Spirochaetota bacterium]HPU87985.1 phosphomannose isomerase type II C-terminal cupin domain [Spirochaetota bacterium]